MPVGTAVEHVQAAIVAADQLAEEELAREALGILERTGKPMGLEAADRRQDELRDIHRSMQLEKLGVIIEG